MTTQHLSLRVAADTMQRLDEESRRTGKTRSEIAKTLLHEGLQMEAHPGIVFRPGPAGRRPGLVAGPDIWEVIRVFRDVETTDGDRAEQTARLMNLSVQQVKVAARYYADYRDEIDRWIARVDEAAERAEAAWHREQELLRR